MFTPSRRIFLYWVLLLVPTLAAGVISFQLLLREQATLLKRSEQVDEARRAALTARARLVAENMELLAGDVETGLLDALAELPAPDLSSSLSRWPKDNPLVRSAFLCALNGRLIFPTANDADEGARGFHRRFASLFLNTPPWGPEPATAKVLSKQSFGQEKQNLQAEASVSNVSNFQKARRDVQNLNRNAAPSKGALLDAELSMSQDSKKEMASPTAAAAAPKPFRRGWRVYVMDNRTHILGWLQESGNMQVRGVELDLAALVSRLSATLPLDLANGESFILRDEQNRPMGQSGTRVAVSSPLIRVPVSSAILQGWTVDAYLQTGSYGSSSGDAFILVGSLLVGTFVIAILIGGSLLFWQARSSALELHQKTSFVSNVSHEFKTPLTTIRLYSELLEQQRVSDPEKRGEYLRTIGRETQRLARLVNNVLDFSRLEQGRKQYRTESIELGTELQRILSTQMPRMAEAGLSLNFVPPAQPVTARCDRDALEQILLNLIDNTCKYAADGGELNLEIAATSPDGACQVRIHDRGPGVPPTERERIFEKFHRVNTLLTAEKTGVGLGLSIARQLARGMGGDLHCSPREGGGASFVLTLPAEPSLQGSPVINSP